jgi:hypothetical protein
MNKITTILISLLIIAMVSLPVMAATYTPAQVLSTIQPYMKAAYAINPDSPMKQSQDMKGQVYIYKLPTNPVVYVYTSSGAIDCDGQATLKCTGTTDPLYQGQTSFTQSDGKPLNAELLPWYVLPETPNPIFDYAKRDIYGGEAGVVLYKGKMEYGVFGDERGRDAGNSKGLAIGEVSYAMASSLGIDPDPANGGIESGVTYIIFTTKANVVVPIESHAAADTKGKSALETMMSQLGDVATLDPTPTLTPQVTNPSANPAIILNDNGRVRPPGTNITHLNVTVTGNISSITIDLSPIGGSGAAPMIKIANTDIYTITANATSGINLTNNLVVNATDTSGNFNNSVSLQLTVLLHGDVNGDGKIDIKDLLFLRRYLAGLEPSINPLVADIQPAEGDGKVDFKDLLLLRRYLAGLEPLI